MVNLPKQNDKNCFEIGKQFAPVDLIDAKAATLGRELDRCAAELSILAKLSAHRCDKVGLTRMQLRLGRIEKGVVMLEIGHKFKSEVCDCEFAPQPVLRAVKTEKPSVSVVGLGYVGAVSTACLSDLGHRVVGVDLDPVKTAAIGAGQAPIHEEQLGDLLRAGVEKGLVSATDDLVQAVLGTDVTFVSVGTPTAADGGCDFSHIVSAANTIGQALRVKGAFHIVVMRCSIPPGTTMDVMVPALEKASGKTCGVDFGVCFNPEFLREGVAVEDFRAPPKTVIGASDPRAAGVVARIFAPVDDAPILTSIETAEMVKYVDNVWHATKVTFANEVGRLCKSLGVDSHDVMDIFVQDTKLNLSPYYLKPGFAYGGSCLPKEVRAVAHIAKTAGVDLPLICNLEASNRAQIDAATQMVKDTGAGTVAVLGLAFKPGTDDLRESPILEVIADLIDHGITVLAHDTAITRKTNIAGQLSYVAHAAPGLAKVADRLGDMLTETAAAAVQGADAIIVAHANDTYREIVASSFKPTVDVVRLFKDPIQSSLVAGIGW